MLTFKERVFKILPNVGKNLLVTLFDYIQYKKRHSGNYEFWLNYYKEAKSLTIDELKEKQLESLLKFLNFAKKESAYYTQLFDSLNITSFNSLDDFYKIPIESKEDLRANIESIYTVDKQNSILSKTGGTTGKSLEVRFTYDDMQNRFASLDSFRAEFGYKLGEKVAWFSGKSLLDDNDIKRNRFWRYDWLYKIRYYSTFHISEATAFHYIDNLNSFQPKFAVGFPSSMAEIAKWGIKNNKPLNYKMTTIFPTAETIVEEEKELIQNYFGGNLVNQYASSEGAPFIVEGKEGKLHMMLLTGYFEVLDENGNQAQEGELVFTSFTTHGTPLIRYAIKDKITLSAETGNYENKNPLVEKVEGRINDFIYSKERGKINLGNISNCVKYVKGVIKFQIIQDDIYSIIVKIVKDETFTTKDETMFLYELRERLGPQINIEFKYETDILKEKSGKYRMVKNSLNL
jgi:phenylacetate-CoA ligase